jgi:MoaA/NifB/PqqE/SkfB family radical SAM enzyme
MSEILRKIFRMGNKYNPIDNKLVEEYNKHRIHSDRSMLCYAPFKNMYLGHHGNVISCCFNRTYFLGRYPEQNLLQIWRGDKASKLRDYIRHNDLSLGCTDCKNLMEGKNFDAIKAKMYDELPLNQKFPSVIEFELDNKCNLECIMCSGDYSSLIRKNREKKPALGNVYDKGFLTQLEEFIPHLAETKFYGGEPFIIDIYYEIWNKIIELNPQARISVQTNATILNTRVKNLLEKGLFHLNISLDSINKETYEKIRINADFDKVMENIKYFYDYCKKNGTFFGISVCPMRQNWKELPEMINYCNTLEVPVYFHMVWFPQTASLWNLSSDKLNEIYEYLTSFGFCENNAVEQKNHTHYTDFVSQVKSWFTKALKREKEFETEQTGILEENKKASQLKDELFKKLNLSITSNNDISEDNKQEKLDLYFNKIENVFKRFPGNFPLSRAILKLINEFPVDLLISELESETEDGLYEKLKDVVYERS